MSVDWSERKPTPPSERGGAPSGQRGGVLRGAVGGHWRMGHPQKEGRLAGCAEHCRPRRTSAIKEIHAGNHRWPALAYFDAPKLRAEYGRKFIDWYNTHQGDHMGLYSYMYWREVPEIRKARLKPSQMRSWRSRGRCGRKTVGTASD